MAALVATGCGGSGAGKSQRADGGAASEAGGGTSVGGPALAAGYTMTTVYAGTPTAYGPMAIDATSAYFVVEDPNAGEDVVQVPLAGGSAIVLATNANDFGGGFALDDSDLYWPDFGNGGKGPDGGATTPDGEVMRVPLTGGTASAVVTGTSASAVAVDDANVYWSDLLAGTLSAVPKGGGAATVLASGQSGVQEIALDATQVYWLTNDSAGIAWLRTVPKSGGTPTKLAEYECTGRSFALHGGFVYWTCGGNVMRTPVAGGATTTLALEQASFEGQLAVDDTAVYWATVDGTVVKLPSAAGLEGATPTVLYSPNSPETNVYNATSVAVDATGLYVLLYGGTLAKISSP